MTPGPSWCGPRTSTPSVSGRGLHRPVTLAALESGKHVLCETRMAMNAAEARTMLEASRPKPELVTQIVPARRP
jgi:predicted dehydrogenase